MFSKRRNMFCKNVFPKTSSKDVSRYHSSFNKEGYPSLAGMMCLPFKSYADTSYPSKDIIDEAIVFYAHIMEADDYPIEGAADKTLIYLFLFMTECLRQCLYVKDLETAKNKLFKLVDAKTLPVPGDVGFPFNRDFGRPKNAFEEYLLRSYLMQLERECLDRFLDIVFRAPETADHDPLEYYLSFANKLCLGGRLKLDL